VQIGFKLRSEGLAEETEKIKKKSWEKKVTKRYISPPRGGAISQPICTKFSEFVDLTELVTLAKFDSKNIHWFFQKEMWKRSIFSLESLRPIYNIDTNLSKSMQYTTQTVSLFSDVLETCRPDIINDMEITNIFNSSIPEFTISNHFTLNKTSQNPGLFRPDNICKHLEHIRNILK